MMKINNPGNNYKASDIESLLSTNWTGIVLLAHDLGFDDLILSEKDDPQSEK